MGSGFLRHVIIEKKLRAINRRRTRLSSLQSLRTIRRGVIQYLHSILVGNER